MRTRNAERGTWNWLRALALLTLLCSALRVPRSELQAASQPLLLLAARPAAAPGGGGGGDVTDGLVGWWKLDDGSGTDAIDSSGNGFTGTVLGGGGTWGSGHINGALTLDGASYVSVGTSGTLNPAAITVSAWIKPSSLADAYQAIWSRIETGVGYVQLFLKSNGKLAVYLDTDGGLPSYDGTGSHTLLVDTWYHVAFTYDSSGGLIGYVNGASDGTDAAAAGIEAFVGTAYIGRDSLTSGREFSGSIDDVRIYNRALTPAEISTLAAQ